VAEDRLWSLRQSGRPLERYVEEFSELSCQVGWPDASLSACFLMGLDEDTIRNSEPACYFSLVESINLVLYLNGSKFEVEEVKVEVSSSSSPIRNTCGLVSLPHAGSLHIPLQWIHPFLSSCVPPCTEMGI